MTTHSARQSPVQRSAALHPARPGARGSRAPPAPPPPQPPQAGPPATPRCGARTLRRLGGLRPPARPPRSPPRPELAAGGWPPAALRGARAPGSAPAASAARPPPGAGPAAAAVRTPAAGRHRQQLPPHCPSSYFSDGSSRCSLGKRSLPAARNRFPTFHQSAQTGRKSNAYFFWWTAHAIDTDLPFKRGEIGLQALGSGFGGWGQAPAPSLTPQTLTLRGKGPGGGEGIIFNSRVF